MTTTNRMRVLTLNGGQSNSSPSFTSHVVDASNEGVGFVFAAQSTGAITHLGFRYGARALTPPTYIIGLESVDATTGLPSGTYKQNAGSDCKATFTPPADTTWDGTWQWVALAFSYTPAIGETLCITIRYSTGTIDATNNSSFSTGVSNLAPLPHYPYGLRNTSGTWAQQVAPPTFGVRTATERYGQIIPNFYSTRTANTLGLRVAAKINLPAGFGSTYKIAGVRLTTSMANATGKAPLLKIWSASAALASVTLDSDVISTAVVTAYRTVESYFPSPPTLTMGTDYYVGLEVGDAGNGGIILYGIQFAAAADAASESGGTICELATYDGASWTTDSTVRPWIELILEDITKPSGGGGGLVSGVARSVAG